MSSATRESMRLALFSRLVGQDPRVFAAATLGGIDDERAAAQRDARQAAGGDAHVPPEEDKGAEIDVTALEVVVHPAGMAGEGEGGLGDVVARVGEDALAEVVTVVLAGVRADEHAVAAALVHRLDHELVQMLQD